MAAKTRDQIRGAIFNSDNTKPKTKTITFFGEQIEIRQPSLGTILDFRNSEDRKEAMIAMVIAYAFVPETDDKVFEEADKDELLLLPFGPDFTELNLAIQELTNVNVMTASAEKNSEGTASGSN